MPEIYLTASLANDKQLDMMWEITECKKKRWLERDKDNREQHEKWVDFSDN